MKKLLFSVLLTLGIFTVSQAQNLFYTVNNTSSVPWSFKIGDGNGNGQYTAPFTGTISNGWANFAFQLEFGGSSSFGCNAYVNLTAPGSGSIPYVCTFSSSWNYTLVQVFGFYILNVQIT